ncbi:MAG TPA: aldo/keto reductase [Planctomycetota bacterium]|nr:aldo/keto reductase [Planctomycetota bacterium]
MEHRSLGSAGLKVPVLSLGCMTFGESQTWMKGVTSPDDEARRVLEVAIDRGVTLLDTADVYSDGRSETLLGEWLGWKRDRVLLATKCRFPLGPGAPHPVGPNDQGLSRYHIVRSCEASLRRLKTDVIDLYQVHMQDRATPIEETLRALDDLVRAGKIRYAACSNFTGYRLVESLWAADRRDTVRFESVQLQWSLVDRGCERDIVPACREFGVGVLVWGALARGFLSGKYRRGEPPPAGSRFESWRDALKNYDRDQNWRVLDAVRAIAERHRTTPSAVAHAWLLARPEVSTLIIGARDVKQLEENLACLEVRLAKDEQDELTKLSELEWGYPQSFIAMREAW